jgi:hypothetical protein
VKADVSFLKDKNNAIQGLKIRKTDAITKILGACSS